MYTFYANVYKFYANMCNSGCKIWHCMWKFIHCLWQIRCVGNYRHYLNLRLFCWFVLFWEVSCLEFGEKKEKKCTPKKPSLYYSRRCEYWEFHHITKNISVGSSIHILTAIMTMRSFPRLDLKEWDGWQMLKTQNTQWWKRLTESVESKSDDPGSHKQLESTWLDNLGKNVSQHFVHMN